MANRPLSKAQILWLYFCGREDVYNVQQPNGSYFHNPKALTEAILQDHVDGKITVASFPLDQDNKTPYGAYDVDDVSDVGVKWTTALRKWLEHHGLPAFVEPSGRRGYHIWLLLKSKLPAEPVQRLLLTGLDIVSRELGKPFFGIEIFPKQVELKGVGLALKLPWGIHRATGNRTTFVDDFFLPLENDGIDAIMASQSVSLIQVEEVLVQYPPKEPPAPNEGKQGRAKKEPREAEALPGLPCFRKGMDGVGEGKRHTVSFRLGVHLYYQGVPERLAEQIMLQWDAEKNQPPLGTAAIKRNLKDAYSGKYRRGCLDTIMQDLCDTSCPIYKARHKEDDGRVQKTYDLIVKELRKLSSSPPTYRVFVDNMEMDLNVEELLTLKAFKAKALATLNCIPCVGMKQTQWEAQVNQWMEALVQEAAPVEASEDGRYISCLYEYLERTPEAEEAEDVLAGRPVCRDDHFFFKMEEALRFLDSHYRLKPSPTRMWALVRSRNGEAKIIRFRGKAFRMWSMPVRQREEPDAPETEVQPPLETAISPGNATGKGDEWDDWFDERKL